MYRTYPPAMDEGVLVGGFGKGVHAIVGWEDVQFAVEVCNKDGTRNLKNNVCKGGCCASVPA